ncbi:MAG: hypothetical protein JWL69_3738 [Phycisphaerales bacterium]|nr:hypothetical protein [Phycisphaerales bacterium]MDB5358080.1 hypothetical protein [Phycisphaerales bacterium]
MHDGLRIPAPRFPDLVLRSPANWTAVAFLALLACLHAGVAVPALMAGRWEGYLSLVIAGLFAMGALATARFRSEMAIQTSRRRIALRTGVGRFCAERFIAFEALSGVRLTAGPGCGKVESRIEILCPFEQIECPPTAVPREQALLLAMMLEVPLIKVCDEQSPVRETPRKRGGIWSVREEKPGIISDD